MAASPVAVSITSVPAFNLIPRPSDITTELASALFSPRRAPSPSRATPRPSPTSPPQAPQAQLNGANPGQPALPPAPPESVLRAIEALTPAVAAQNDQEIVTAVVDIVQGLLEAGGPFAVMGQRLVKAFREMEDTDEMYTFAKSLWIVGGARADKRIAKTVAQTLVRWYSVIHEQMFGVSRSIGDAAEEPAQEAGSAEEGSEETEESDESDESDSAEAGA
jgi:hypothetical protein